MSVKLIAVDMDGTFLSTKKTYNRELFQEVYAEMEKRDIKFVVASGNQYYQLRSFFPEMEDKITFVAENGALIVHQREKLFVGEIPKDIVVRTLAVVSGMPAVMLTICGEKSAYILKNETPDYFIEAQAYYHRLKWIDDLSEIDDKIIKFALNVKSEDVSRTLVALEEGLKGYLTPVSSGHGAIDLITPGTHKAHGLTLLQDHWGIPTKNVVAFGDSGNDLEMIRHAGLGFGMKNAAPSILECADKMTEFDNNHDGVLVEIQRLLG